MQSKKGVSASIEKQEVANQQNAARAEMQLDQAKMSEQLRLQNVSMSEARRIQQAEAQGAAYEFQARERREGEQLDRAQAEVENAQATVAGYQQARDAGVAGAISSLGNVATSLGGVMNESAANKLDTRNPENIFGKTKSENVEDPMGGRSIGMGF